MSHQILITFAVPAEATPEQAKQGLEPAEVPESALDKALKKLEDSALVEKGLTLDLENRPPLQVTSLQPPSSEKEDTSEEIYVVGAFLEEDASPTAIKDALNDEKEAFNLKGIDDDEVLVLFRHRSANLALDQHEGTYEQLNEVLDKVLMDGDKRLDGEGVYVVFIDSGINLDHLEGWLGDRPHFNEDWSYDFIEKEQSTGDAEPGHGTQMAYNALLGAPKCTLVDLKIFEDKSGLGEPPVSSVYRATSAVLHLIDIIEESGDDAIAVVVNNSWGILRPTFDINVITNRNHDLNKTLAGLEQGIGMAEEALKVDILFAAGNCGGDYTAGNIPCIIKGKIGRYGTIFGPNSHKEVLSVGASTMPPVGATTLDGVRLAYSSQGPGSLEDEKPDILAPAHFLGPYPPVKDTGNWNRDRNHIGTSTACSVATGVIAAIRSKYPKISSKALRKCVQATATKKGDAGYDRDSGYGHLNPKGLIIKLKQGGPC